MGLREVTTRSHVLVMFDDQHSEILIFSPRFGVVIQNMTKT
jgi:hypothetical protein